LCFPLNEDRRRCRRKRTLYRKKGKGRSAFERENLRQKYRNCGIKTEKRKRNNKMKKRTSEIKKKIRK
jgi:hypothetical protein